MKKKPVLSSATMALLAIGAAALIVSNDDVTNEANPNPPSISAVQITKDAAVAPEFSDGCGLAAANPFSQWLLPTAPCAISNSAFISSDKSEDLGGTKAIFDDALNALRRGEFSAGQTFIELAEECRHASALAVKEAGITKSCENLNFAAADPEVFELLKVGVNRRNPDAQTAMGVWWMREARRSYDASLAELGQVPSDDWIARGELRPELSNLAFKTALTEAANLFALAAPNNNSAVDQLHDLVAFGFIAPSLQQ